jgi:superfamily II DNA/RNA helicase
VDQFHGELRDRGYRDRISPALLKREDGSEPHDPANGLVTVETYQWFVRNAGKVSDAYTIVICDEAHTALGEKTSASIREWAGPVFIGMTATGALIARHVTDLFPTQTSRFDLAQAARRGVISPLRCVRIPPGPGVRTIAKVPLRRGDVDVEFDQELLAELLDQLPFNLAIADLYKTRFEGVPGVIYAAGVRHAYNVAEAFRDVGLKARAVSGETPKRELAETLAAYERGDVDVLVNAQLLAEGWNSPRATVCMHLAPTASKRIYQQRVGRVTRRHPGKESGIVVDFVHPATKHDDPVVTLHSLLDRDRLPRRCDRRGSGAPRPRAQVARRAAVLPVCADENRGSRSSSGSCGGSRSSTSTTASRSNGPRSPAARVAPNGWRRARAMLHFDQGGELKRAFLLTALQRNKNAQLRHRALQEIAAAKDAEAFDLAVDVIGGWPRDERREGVQGRPAGAGGEEDRPARPGQQLDLALREPDARRTRGVRRAALAGDEAAAGTARQLERRRARAQRPPARAVLAPAGPSAERGAAGRRAAPHRRGRGGRQRRADAHVAQARRARARAAAQLPEGQSRATASRRRRPEETEVSPLQEPLEALDALAEDDTDTEIQVEPADGVREAPSPVPAGSTRVSGERRVIIADDVEAYSPEVTAADKDRPKRTRSRRGRGAPRGARGGRPRRTARIATVAADDAVDVVPVETGVPAGPDAASPVPETPKPKRTRTRKPVEAVEAVEAAGDEAPKPKPKPKRARARTTTKQARTGRGASRADPAAQAPAPALDGQEADRRRGRRGPRRVRGRPPRGARRGRRGLARRRLRRRLQAQFVERHRPMGSRWTSPPSSVVSVPSSRRTRRAPAASMPAPTPWPSAQRSGRSRSASRALSARIVASGGSASRRRSASSSSASAGSSSSGARPSVPALPRSSGGNSPEQPPR